MAISPPSDILLDVASAADPARVQAATARLATLAADPSAPNTGFSEALARAKGGAQAAANLPASSMATTPAFAPSVGAPSTSPKPKTSVYTKFEAVLLQSFVESMLPKDEELFGDKNSAGVYRSMMAEQFANEIAKAGGIGIAKSIEAAHPAMASRGSSGSKA